LADLCGTISPVWSVLTWWQSEARRRVNSVDRSRAVARCRSDCKARNSSGTGNHNRCTRTVYRAASSSNRYDYPVADAKRPTSATSPTWLVCVDWGEYAPPRRGLVRPKRAARRRRLGLIDSPPDQSLRSFHPNHLATHAHA
jgi:hypothetical protein